MDAGGEAGGRQYCKLQISNCRFSDWGSRNGEQEEFQISNWGSVREAGESQISNFKLQILGLRIGDRGSGNEGQEEFQISNSRFQIADFKLQIADSRIGAGLVER
jgi:hypothetical protein